MNRAIAFLALLLFALRPAAAADQPGPVPPEIAAIARAAQEETNPAMALERLQAHEGKPHALISLLIGQMSHRLARQDERRQSEHREAAEKAYRQALGLEPGMRPAALGLAQLAADRSDWPQALTWCAKGIDVGSAGATEVLFYAQIAHQAHDARLTTTLIDQGIMRFPEESGFRRLEIAMLIQAERAEEAGHAARDLLTRMPDDTDLWRNLSWAKQSRGENMEALAALEAACLSKPDDRELARRLGESQFAQGLPQAALETFRGLIGAPPTAAALSDAGLIEVAARAAADSGEIAQARAWLGSVPDKNRSRTQRLLAVRLAVEAEDVAAADAAIRELIALGENDPGILTWAGHLAEKLGDDARAEALYSEAAAGDGAAAGTATLRLAVLYHRQNRLDEASTLVASHLAKHPDDQHAIALRSILAARRQEHKP